MDASLGRRNGLVRPHARQLVRAASVPCADAKDSAELSQLAADRPEVFAEENPYIRRKKYNNNKTRSLIGAQFGPKSGCRTRSNSSIPVRNGTKASGKFISGNRIVTVVDHGHRYKAGRMGCTDLKISRQMVGVVDETFRPRSTPGYAWC